MNTTIHFPTKQIQRSRFLSVVVLSLCYILFSGSALFAQTGSSESWSSIYSTNAKGNITFIGNTNASCNTGDNCPNIQNGTDPTSNANNGVAMAYVDVDDDATTTNSSSADLTLPSGASVLYAGLFWGGARTTFGMDTIRFATPTADYITLKATKYIGGSSSNADYQCYKDVTALVQAGGSGTYYGAKVSSSLQGNGALAGWVLVIVYSDPAQPMRNLNVFRGFTTINSSSSQKITISGFKSPLSGDVHAQVGIVGWEGDRGPGSTYTGDSVKFKNTFLFNALNPINDVLNSSMTVGGTQFTAKSPNYVNQLGVDADIFTTTNVLSNGDTSASVKFTSGGESYILGCVTTAIEIYAPDILATKSAADVNGGTLVPGDTLEYTLSLTNNGSDSASTLVLFDTIPANTSYVTGSLAIVSGYNAGAKSDASGDDQASYNANVVSFNLGREANGAHGGVLGIGRTTSLKFKVKVNNETPNSTVLRNQAQLTYKALQTGASLSSTSLVSQVTVHSAVAGMFNLSPSGIAFGSVTSGSSKTDSVKVWNSGDGAVNISSVTSTNDMFTVSPQSALLGAFDTVMFHITYTPTTSGAASGNINFIHNAAGSPGVVSVSGTGTGTFYTITTTAGANGSISPAGVISVALGENKSFTITADEGYQIDSIFADGAYVGVTTPYTFSNISANHIISAKFSFILPDYYPHILSISPNTKSVNDSAFTLTVNGTHYTASSVVRFDGNEKTTSFVSDSVLTASILVGDFRYPGAYPVVVYTPGVGGGTSNTAYLTVIDNTKFRTFAVDTMFSKKPIKLKITKGKPYPLATLANVRDTILKKNNGLVVGIRQDKKSVTAKKVGWIYWKKGPDMGAFYTGIDTGKSYPLDTIRLPKMKPKVFLRELKVTHKSYKNRLAQEMGMFRLNMIAGLRGVCPSQPIGYNLQDLLYIESGNPFTGMRLGDIANRVDSAMTHWKDLTDTVNHHPSYATMYTILNKINKAFSSPIDSVDFVYADYKNLVVRPEVELHDVPFLGRDYSGKTSFTTMDFGQSLIPDEITLQQNYPNPFNPSTMITFVMNQPSIVTLKVYDVLGREVATLLSNQSVEEGSHEVSFDAGKLSSGVYFYRMSGTSNEAGQDFSFVKKMMLLR